MKRLESRRYRWPDENVACVSISNRELSSLLDGLNIRQKKAHQSLIIQLFPDEEPSDFYQEKKQILDIIIVF